MKKQISRISIRQTSKVIAVLYGAFTLIFVPFGILTLVVGGKGRASGFFFILAPLLYAVLGYAFVAFAAWLYNQIAARMGGVEFEVRDAENPEA